MDKLASFIQSNKKKEQFAIYLTCITFIIIISMAMGALYVIISNGISLFWQSSVYNFQLKNGEQVLGTIFKLDNKIEGDEKIQIKVANKDLFGFDYKWIAKNDIKLKTKPENVVLVKRESKGDFIGYLTINDTLSNNQFDFSQLKNKYTEIAQLKADLNDLVTTKNSFDRQLYEIDQKIIKSTYQKVSVTDPDFMQLQKDQTIYAIKLDAITAKYNAIYSELQKAIFTLSSSDNQQKSIKFIDVRDILYPNQMNIVTKMLFYFQQFGRFIIDNPKEANTEGGIFPAIFGTISLIFLMSLISFPLGVITAIYLQEYTTKGWLLSSVRISVNNLAGVPSIVYGMFGLSVFVYGIGGLIDQIFYPEKLPTPTMGTGNILWASLTLGLLTAPVVIVATEEALAAIPRGLREASYALGATKLQTIIRVVIPLAAPGMLTGFILAMARAAGEVAPLMITGVVKLAPSLPIDLNFPYIHLDRKFMHIGFHIFDAGFQSPNVEASKGIVYMSTIVLLFIVIFLSAVAIYYRNKMINKHTIY